jgi:hypothetical protein
MRSLFKLISRFFQQLLGSRSASSPSRPSRRLAESDPPIGTLAAPSVAAPLRRLLYQVVYELPSKKRTHTAQVGALLRKKDPLFSYEKYNFAKLIDLLEAVPELFALERVDPEPGSPSSAPVYYARPVTNLKQLLIDGLSRYDSADGWVHLESLRDAIALQDPTFSPQKYGFSDFAAFLKSRQDLVECKADSSDYVRLVQEVTMPGRSMPVSRASISKPSAAKPSNGKPSNGKPSNGKPSNGKLSNGKLSNGKPRNGIKPMLPKSRTILHLAKFAGLSPEVLNQKVSDLAAIALPEPWYFGAQPPVDFAYPILKSYLRYTFIRLQHEQKVLANADYCAFNTGLLDRLLRPIYALLAQQSAQAWDLSFCIPGEGVAGKTLVSKFTQMPMAANYLANPAEAFYHLDSGAPEVDWRHVVQDNMERLPPAFIQQYAPRGFAPQDTQTLVGSDFHSYKKAFADALDADLIAYRNIVNRLEAALNRTLLKTQINYKTAVPTYYPKINSIDLLLPICLIDEDVADCAIVARREPSGKYIGHTILTMRQAYNNARLICQLDEHWLSRSMSLSQTDFDADDDDSEEFEAEANALESLDLNNLV